MLCWQPDVTEVRDESMRGATYHLCVTNQQVQKHGIRTNRAHTRTYARCCHEQSPRRPSLPTPRIAVFLLPARLWSRRPSCCFVFLRRQVPFCRFRVLERILCKSEGTQTKRQASDKLQKA